MAGTYAFAYFSRSVHYYYGPWNDVNNRFLGVSFSLDGETHYGWIRMSVNLGRVRDVRAIVTGYAYESTANASIRAGQTSGDVDSNSNEQSAALTESSAQRGGSLGMLAGGAIFNRNRGAVKSYDLCRAQSD